jgi:nitrite reductase/ring-hydroxylating ferredoxin subunit
MAEDSSELTGPDFEKGSNRDDVAEGAMLLGHAFGEPVLVARFGPEFFAIGAKCTHYGGPLNQGLMLGDSVRCPWHHACFNLRTGEAIGAPSLNDTSCWKIEKRDERFFVTGKVDNKPARKPIVSPSALSTSAREQPAARRRKCCAVKVTVARSR